MTNVKKCPCGKPCTDQIDYSADGEIMTRWICPDHGVIYRGEAQVFPEPSVQPRREA